MITVISNQGCLLETKVIKTLNHKNDSESEGCSVGWVEFSGFEKKLELQLLGSSVITI